MAIDPRKRQKKLAKSRAKRKSKALANRRAQQGRPQHAALGLEFELAVRGPIDECYVSEILLTPGYNQGLGTVIVTRLASGGMVAAGVYLLDVFCLGVKDSFATLMTREEFRQFLSQTNLQEPMKNVEPAVAKKLIEDSVAYARSLGFDPHPDFRPARKLLEDIDVSACMMEFTFGDRGKPHFISGPNDTPARIRQICDTLERTCGKDNYKISILLGDPFGDDDYYDEDDDGEGGETNPRETH
jgi:hypothetical protein